MSSQLCSLFVLIACLFHTEANERVPRNAKARVLGITKEDDHSMEKDAEQKRSLPLAASMTRREPQVSMVISPLGIVADSKQLNEVTHSLAGSVARRDRQRATPVSLYDASQGTLVDTSTSKRVQRVRVSGNWKIVCYVTFDYDDSTSKRFDQASRVSQQENLCAPTLHAEQVDFLIPDGDYLVTLEAKMGKSLDAIRFTTATGVKSIWYGNEKTNATNGGIFNATSGHHMYDLLERAGYESSFPFQFLESPMPTAPVPPAAPYRRVMRIQVASGDLISWIAFIYDDYSVVRYAPLHPDASPRSPSWTVPNHERITEVTTWGDVNALNGIAFKTDQNTQSPVFGQPVGSTGIWRAGDQFHIVGFAMRRWKTSTSQLGFAGILTEECPGCPKVSIATTNTNPESTACERSQTYKCAMYDDEGYLDDLLWERGHSLEGDWYLNTRSPQECQDRCLSSFSDSRGWTLDCKIGGDCRNGGVCSCVRTEELQPKLGMTQCSGNHMEAFPGWSGLIGCQLSTEEAAGKGHFYYNLYGSQWLWNATV